MNNRIKFILPRLLGITVLAGLAAFVLSMVFKLLLASLFIAAIGSLVAKIIRNKREKHMPYQRFNEKFLPYDNDFAVQRKSAFTPMDKENLAIIPIH
ncbi:hypothetical protein HNP38_001156 [Chryseobacterium defluvii]|uniref:Uncharacterized protein n=1 Tax=Chryseobacterium defluvii TaxID=160396 RepID=A0A840KDP2_9FLAO|nr:hypothetical protein [Chryseobacterium defluvii]MBB4805884.1 hypothetical protein [Chryseobacterium defluvii]